VTDIRHVKAHATATSCNQLSMDGDEIRWNWMMNRLMNHLLLEVPTDIPRL
jgi:hypothetical protein